MIANYLWVDDVNTLNNVLCDLDCSVPIAVDTEFERSRTYYMNPAIMQLWDGQQAVLIDLTNQDLYQLMSSFLKSIILHSGSEDMELIIQLFDNTPSDVFDTQIAAALCGYGTHISYQNLVFELLQENIPKDASRTDWLQRPLKQTQIDYAINDVKYLPALRNILIDKLTNLGFLPLFKKLSEKWLTNIKGNDYNKKSFIKMVRAERLNKPQQQKLWVLLEWREQQAIQRNKPRKWIINNKQIIDIVRYVSDVDDFNGLRFNPKFIQYHAKDICQKIQNDDLVNAHDMPEVVRLGGSSASYYQYLKDELHRVCGLMNVPTSMLINTDGLKELAYKKGKLVEITGWAELYEVCSQRK